MKCPRPTHLAALAMVTLASGPALAMETYRLTVDNTWSEATHPGAFPADAHFSWLGGGTHSGAVSFWEEGQIASPGMVQMAESGVTSILLSEVNDAIVAGTAYQGLNWTYWFCPDGVTNAACGPLVVEFEVDERFPLVTLVSMLGPSPDWFVGVSGLPLHDGTAWIDDLTVELYPYDGGTRDANVFELFGPLTTPPEPISLITAQSGQLVGPGSLGTLHFERLGIAAVPAMSNGVLVVLAALLAGLGALVLRRRLPTA